MALEQAIAAPAGIEPATPRRGRTQTGYTLQEKTRLALGRFFGFIFIQAYLYSCNKECTSPAGTGGRGGRGGGASLR